MRDRNPGTIVIFKPKPILSYCSQLYNFLNNIVYLAGTKDLYRALSGLV